MSFQQGLSGLNAAAKNLASESDSLRTQVEQFTI